MNNGFVINDRLFLDKVLCTASECTFKGLPKEVFDLCASKTAVYMGKGEFFLMTNAQYDEYLSQINKDSEYNKFKVCMHSELISDERTLFLALFHAMKSQNKNLPHDCVFHLEFTKNSSFIVITIMNTSELLKA